MLLPCVDVMDEINRPGMRGGREDERGGLPASKQCNVYIL